MQLWSQERPNQILCFPADPQVVPGALAPPGSAALPGAGPLSATRQTSGALPLDDHFKQPLKKVFPSSCLPQEQLRSPPLSQALFLRCLSETPAEGRCLRGSEGAVSWALACPLWSGVRVFLEKGLDSRVIMGMEAES